MLNIHLSYIHHQTLIELSFCMHILEYDIIRVKSIRSLYLDPQLKKEIIGSYGLHGTDSGSAEVQVALLTSRIGSITDHLRSHKHDYHSQRGLLKLVGRRRRLLGYLNRYDVGRYSSVVSRLKLRG